VEQGGPASRGRRGTEGYRKWTRSGHVEGARGLGRSSVGAWLSTAASLLCLLGIGPAESCNALGRAISPEDRLAESARTTRQTAIGKIPGARSGSARSSVARLPDGVCRTVARRVLTVRGQGDEALSGPRPLWLLPRRKRFARARCLVPARRRTSASLRLNPPLPGESQASDRASSPGHPAGRTRRVGTQCARRHPHDPFGRTHEGRPGFPSCLRLVQWSTGPGESKPHHRCRRRLDPRR
jgi:hypothetical protein